jgi:Flp pilus assembly protein TadG
MQKFLKCDRGTQLIELAIVLPVLILMFASAVEMGRMFFTYTTLQKSTEGAARYLSSVQAPNGTFASADITTAKNMLVCGKTATCSGETPIVSGLQAGNVTITSPGTGVGIRYVTVSVSYAYTPLVFNLGSMTGSQNLSLNYTFTPSIKMRYML